MKTLIVVAALGLGAGAVALTLAVQADRFAFTRLENQTPLLAKAELSLPRLPTPPASPVARRVVGIPEVNVTGRLGPPQAVAKQIATVPARVQKVAPKVAPHAVVHEPGPPIDKVIPAPCVDGEYRKIDQTQGVRLMCPGGHEALASPEQQD